MPRQPPLTKGGATTSVLLPIPYNGTSLTLAPETYFVGPATLAVVGNSSTSKTCLSYKLFDNSTVAGPVTPSTAVVIPADASGPVNIVLESSTDLITWTAATPGSYGSSNSKRFFRVRAVAQ